MVFTLQCSTSSCWLSSPKVTGAVSEGVQRRTLPSSPADARSSPGEHSVSDGTHSTMMRRQKLTPRTPPHHINRLGMLLEGGEVGDLALFAIRLHLPDPDMSVAPSSGQSSLSMRLEMSRVDGAVVLVPGDEEGSSLHDGGGSSSSERAEVGVVGDKMQDCRQRGLIEGGRASGGVADSVTHGAPSVCLPWPGIRRTDDTTGLHLRPGELGPRRGSWAGLDWKVLRLQGLPLRARLATRSCLHTALGKSSHVRACGCSGLQGWERRVLDVSARRMVSETRRLAHEMQIETLPIAAGKV